MSLAWQKPVVVRYMMTDNTSMPCIYCGEPAKPDALGAVCQECMARLATRGAANTTAEEIVGQNVTAADVAVALRG